MARTDAIVLGAGIVGTSIALHLAKRGLSVALFDRRGPGEETSFGNAGVIEGNTLFPHPFPADFGALMRVALKQAPEANYHLSFLPQIAPWLLAYRANSSLERRMEFAKHDAAAVQPRHLRARGADGGGGRDPLPAQGRLAQALPHAKRGFATPRAEREVAAKFGLRATGARSGRGALRSSRRWRRSFTAPCIGRAPRASAIRWR